MRSLLKISLLYVVFAASVEDEGQSSSQQREAAAVPADIAVPPGQHIVLSAHAYGVQVYECRADAGGALAWGFRAPAALLFSPDRQVVASHFGGVDVGLPPGPYWKSVDGS